MHIIPSLFIITPFNSIASDVFDYYYILVIDSVYCFIRIYVTFINMYPPPSLNTKIYQAITNICRRLLYIYIVLFLYIFSMRNLSRKLAVNGTKSQNSITTISLNLMNNLKCSKLRYMHKEHIHHLHVLSMTSCVPYSL